jgi:hypothetical protein
MDFSYLNNPIILGIVAATVVYIYLYYNAKNETDKKKKKKSRVNILTPGIVGLVVWFVTSTIFDKKDSGEVAANPVESIKNISNASNKSPAIYNKSPAIYNKSPAIYSRSVGTQKVKNMLSAHSPHIEKPNLVNKPVYKLIDSPGSESYHLVGKNKVRLPPTDVFIDVAKF